MEGTRICFKDSYGTVRWAGHIQNKEGRWIGIEWDDHEKGKHSGCFEGIQYFQTRFPNCGSFIKEQVFMTDLNPGCSIEYAIFHKYADWNEMDLSETYVSTVKNQKKIIELVGTEKIMKKQEKVENLKEIALQGCFVISITSGFGQKLENCETLRLDQNLLNSWDQISAVLEELPQLRTLSLSNNRLELPLTNPKTSALQILVLNNMALTCSDLLPILPQFPSLQELHLYKNFCNDFNIPLYLLEKLTLLNLEDNKISDWETVSNQCKDLENLEKLILNENPIGHVVYQGGFRKLTALSIENCNICEWTTVDELGKFPGLIKELRIARNNALGQGSSLTLLRFNAIARIGSLQMLSGSAVRVQERIEAERFFLRANVDVPGIGFSIRWQELVQKHGPPSEISCKVVNEKDNLAEQTLSSNTVTILIRSLAKASAGKEMKKKLILNMSVADLKNMCSKLFNLKNTQIKLSFRDTNSIMPEFFEDNLKSIGYYILSDNGEIWVEDLN
jgi:tubulin-specific chaperone E